jgi:hypothetical protein
MIRSTAALLMHLPDPTAALARMVAALRSGGLLLVEEGDYGLWSYGGPADAPRLNKLVTEVLTKLASAKNSGSMPSLLLRSSSQSGQKSSATVCRTTWPEAVSGAGKTLDREPGSKNEVVVNQERSSVAHWVKNSRRMVTSSGLTGISASVKCDSVSSMSAKMIRSKPPTLGQGQRPRTHRVRLAPLLVLVR